MVGGSFFIYGHVPFLRLQTAFHIMRTSIGHTDSRQTPKASPGAASAVKRDAHILRNPSTHLKRKFY